MNKTTLKATFAVALLFSGIAMNALPTRKYITVEQAKKAWRDYWKDIIIVRCRNSDGMSPSDFMYSYLSNPVFNPLGEYDRSAEVFLKGPSSVEVAVLLAAAVLAVAALGYALDWSNTRPAMSETEVE